MKPWGGCLCVYRRVGQTMLQGVKGKGGVVVLAAPYDTTSLSIGHCFSLLWRTLYFPGFQEELEEGRLLQEMYLAWSLNPPGRRWWAERGDGARVRQKALWPAGHRCVYLIHRAPPLDMCNVHVAEFLLETVHQIESIS